MIAWKEENTETLKARDVGHIAIVVVEEGYWNVGERSQRKNAAQNAKVAKKTETTPKIVPWLFRLLRLVFLHSDKPDLAAAVIGDEQRAVG